jgi:hypothetical protein
MGLFGAKWEPGTGVLIDTKYGGDHGNWATANGNKTQYSVHYLMEVTPDSGAAPFRCECEAPPLMSFVAPDPGVKVRMLCDPSKRKAKFDRHDPKVSRKSREAADRSRYAAELAEEPTGTDAAGGSEAEG